MFNELLFIVQTILVIALGLFFSTKSLRWLTAWLSSLSVLMNTLSLKQISFLGLEITSGDVYMIGLLACVNFAREIHDQDKVQDAVMGSWIISISFLILSQLHLAFLPSPHDFIHPHIAAILKPAPRIILASLTTMMVVQMTDLALFTFLKSLFRNKWFGLRSTLSLICSQFLDTILFTFLGLYGLVANLGHIILFSSFTKIAAILIAIPITMIGKWIAQRSTS